VDLDIPKEEINARLAADPVPPIRRERGYVSLYRRHVTQAHEGCDFDFLRALPGEPASAEPLGLLSGWIGGW
jgi:dihydroxyacid dehydratase/phosphogluconate dehydratase